MCEHVWGQRGLASGDSVMAALTGLSLNFACRRVSQAAWGWVSREVTRWNKTSSAAFCR